jgi:hypothetical protein
VKGLKEEGATHKLENFDRKDLDPLLYRIGDARHVLLEKHRMVHLSSIHGEQKSQNDLSPKKMHTRI